MRLPWYFVVFTALFTGFKQDRELVGRFKDLDEAET
jgi:hypothetical protein